MGRGKGFGLWELVSKRPLGDELATVKQKVAARYLIDDMPVDATLGFEAARELLSVRSYVIGLLLSLYKQGAHPHPREAMWWILREAYLQPLIIKTIRKWNKDRYFEDRGPARVGATRHFDELCTIALTYCRASLPSEADCLAVRDAELSDNGLGDLISSNEATIDYRDGDEVTTRYISGIKLTSQWPWWSYLLINPPSFISIEACCHLRGAHRTFAAFKIARVA